MMVRSARALGLALFALSVGCGGAEKPATAPDGADSERPSGGEAESEGADDGSDEPSHDEAAATKASCDDGTCAPCGDALCPTGWYCDESAPGGAACGWLPECAKKPGCACVKRAFSGCSCDDGGGIARVSCSSKDG